MTARWQGDVCETRSFPPSRGVPLKLVESARGLPPYRPRQGGGYVPTLDPPPFPGQIHRGRRRRDGIRQPERLSARRAAMFGRYFASAGVLERQSSADLKSRRILLRQVVSVTACDPSVCLLKHSELVSLSVRYPRTLLASSQGMS